jgi:hypothetical protein
MKLGALLIVLAASLWLSCLLPCAAQEQQKPPGGDSGSSERNKESSSPVSQALRTYQTVRIETGTWLAKPEMCEGALQKHREFDDWQLAIVRSRVADVLIKIDHQPGWFYYQYSMIHTPTQLVLMSGNVTAWDGNVACKMVAKAIIDRTKAVRQTPKHEPSEPDKKKNGSSR